MKRFAQNFFKDINPVAFSSRNNKWVIINPLMTKKIGTPKYPSGSVTWSKTADTFFGKSKKANQDAWHMMTSSIEIPRSPSNPEMRKFMAGLLIWLIL